MPVECIRTGVSERYVLAVKPSARRASATVGAWVRDEGPHRRFESKALARAWAREACPPDRALWVQDAPPWVGGCVDGYLVAGRRGTGRRDGASQRTLDTALHGAE